MDYTDILKTYFGYSAFRGIQREIVESIGSGKDTLGLMPTGGGKSITFQVPALAKEGVCIVITPLIALMKDQVAHLKEKGILASAIYSGMSHYEVLQVLDNAVYGGVKFLYVAPERLSTQLFQVKITQMKVCFITVDEAHCISQWGYDFRPAYLKISQIRELLPDVPVLALTATATNTVVDDIQYQLKFRENCVFRMSFKRDNLIYVVRKTDSKQSELLHILRSVPGCAIVYERSRLGTKKTAKFLVDNGISATFYHAGLDPDVKDQRQQDWQHDNVRVMVATNAFGMGIDKPDVRLVVHMESPDSLEAYFQEAGRGGRDGKRSYAVLLYNKSDKRVLNSHVTELFPDKDYIRKVYDDLAYFFQLGVESGEGTRYEFDMERFCRVFKHFPVRLHGALSVLQRAGYIEFDLSPDTKPRCKMMVRRDDLYYISGLTADDDAVLTMLMRTYTGLFADYVFINETLIANNLHMSKEYVHDLLISLSKRRIIHYIPRRNVPIITYVHQRVDSCKLIFAKDIYEDLREKLVERVNSVIEFITNDNKCRSVMLLDYFGEKNAEDCGKCDVCLSDKEVDVSSPIYIIKEAFDKNGGKLLISDINNLPVPRKLLDCAIAELREKEHIYIKNACLYWAKE